MKSACLVVLFVVFGLLAETCHAALPEGFEDQGMLHIRWLLDLAFGTHRDGTELLYGVTKPGKVHVLTNFQLEDEEPTNEIVLDLADRMCDDGERGLGGVELHPNFQENGYIYLFYTIKNSNENDPCQHDLVRGPSNRCSRWKVLDDYSIDPDSEEIIFTTRPLGDKVHNGGDMAFGVDGMLYVGLGDNGERRTAYSQDLSHFFGKIIRVTDVGGIPDDNPYTGPGTVPCAATGGIPDSSPEDTICQEIYSYGLRNPFRFAMDPHSSKVRFLINDVGAKDWEETNVGGEDYMRANYGWPVAEGPCDYASDEDCPVYEEYEDPIYWYQHNKAQEGAAVGIAIVPPAINWPQEYHRTFFYCEHVDGLIFHVEEDSDNYCRDCIPPRPGYKATVFHEFEYPIGLKFGPYQNNLRAMYYTSRSLDVNLRRIVYKGSDNTAPIADFQISKSIIPVGGTVEFDASESFDPNPEDSLTYLWDFGDGSELASGKVVQHTFDAAGTYEVELIVQDPAGFDDSARRSITVGSPPTVEILDPPDGAQFAVGDYFVLVGAATDDQGNTLDSSSLSWEVRQHHGSHWHPFFSGDGNDRRIGPAPKPEDFLAAKNSKLEVRLTGTDSLGLSTTVSKRILPKTVWLDFYSVPTGLTIYLDDEPQQTPTRALSWENYELHVRAPDQEDYMFVKWSDGMSQSDKILVPVGLSGTQQVPAYTATFRLNLPTQSPMTKEPSASLTTKEPTLSPSTSPTTQEPMSQPVPAPAGTPTSQPVDGTSMSPPVTNPVESDIRFSAAGTFAWDLFCGVATFLLPCLFSL